MIRQEPSSAHHDLRDIFRDAALLYARNAVPFLAISAAIIPLELIERIAGDSSLYTIATAALLVVQLVAVGALIAAVGDAAAGRRPDLAQAIGRAVERFWPLLRTALLLIAVILPAAGLLFVGFWLAVDEETSSRAAVAPSLLVAGAIVAVPTVYLMVRWLFTLQAVMFDGTGAVDSLHTSWNAVSGNWWTTFALATVLAVGWYAPGWIARYALGWTPMAVWHMVAIVAQTALLPFSVAAGTLLYPDLLGTRANLISPANGFRRLGLT